MKQIIGKHWYYTCIAIFASGDLDIRERIIYTNHANSNSSEKIPLFQNISNKLFTCLAIIECACFLTRNDSMTFGRTPAAIELYVNMLPALLDKR